MSDPAREVNLYDPQTLYRHWEDSQWNPWDIDLSVDREQWSAMDDDRSLVSFVLGSLMVAEERITTKFSGLVGADASEEEVAFLATQQVDEARHMQFYARFQDEVVSEPAEIAVHVGRAREQRLAGLSDDLRRAARRGPRPVARNPGDGAAKVAFVTIYHLILEATLGLTTFEFVDPIARSVRACCRDCRGLRQDPRRRASAHRLRRLVPARGGGARDRRMGDVVRADAARAAARPSPSRSRRRAVPTPRCSAPRRRSCARSR